MTVPPAPNVPAVVAPAPAAPAPVIGDLQIPNIHEHLARMAVMLVERQEIGIRRQGEDVWMAQQEYEVLVQMGAALGMPAV